MISTEKRCPILNSSLLEMFKQWHIMSQRSEKVNLSIRKEVGSKRTTFLSIQLLNAKSSDSIGGLFLIKEYCHYFIMIGPI